jgi:hypothetical protein
VRSCNHCWSGKATSIIHCVCDLSYPACNVHAPYCHLWPAQLYNIFPHLSHNWHKFRGEKNYSHKMCVFISSTSFLEIFLILKKLNEIRSKISSGLYVKYPLVFLISNFRHVLNVVCFLLGNSPASNFNATWIFSIVFRKIFQYNFVQIRPVGAEVFHTDSWMDGQTGGRTDMMKLIVAFRNFSTFVKVFPVYCLFPLDIYLEVKVLDGNCLVINY